jgi:predicted sugar kinase
MLAAHVIRVWRSNTGDRELYEHTIDAPPLHVGLGTSAAVQTGVLAALNWLNGLPLSEPEMLRLLGTSYIEVAHGRSTRGYTTGLSAHLNLYGGFATVDETGSITEHVTTLKWRWAAIPTARLKRAPAGNEEHLFVAKRGMIADATDTGKRTLFADLAAAAHRNDIQAFGEAVAKLQRIGSKREEISLFDPDVNAYLNLARSYAPCCFMSAAGPIVILVSDQCNLIERVEALGIPPFATGHIDNTGLVLRSADT